MPDTTSVETYIIGFGGAVVVKLATTGGSAAPTP